MLWTDQFVCLADHFKNEAIYGFQALLEAGLDIVDCSAKEFHEKLFDEFPKLKAGGGFEFMRCGANRAAE